MIRKVLLLIIICTVWVGCTNVTSVPTATPESELQATEKEVTPDIPSPTTGPGREADSSGLPNPASVYCKEQGYTVTLIEGEGGTVGVCLFPDGSECEEWAFFRDECRPGDSLQPATSQPTVTIVALAEDGWQIYQNDELDYQFHYPAGAIIEPADDPQRTVTVRGPLVDDEYWPVFFISHPDHLEMYFPPDDVDLAEWLMTNNLIPAPDQPQAAEIRLEDVQIAGQTAIHTRFNRSPQSYAFDKYFFAHAGRLFSIVILHTGDKEDWDLYQHFLDSFQFDA